MKTQGLRLADSRIATAERLEKLAAAVKAACIDIQLTQERDGTHQSPGSTVFTAAEMDTEAVMARAEQERLAYLLRLRLTANVKRPLDRARRQSGWKDAGQGSDRV